MKQLLDGIPEDMPVLIDEAYHHFVDDPNYATSVPVRARGPPGHHRAHVLEDRRRSPACASATRSRRAAIIQQMRPYSTGTINAIVK